MIELWLVSNGGVAFGRGPSIASTASVVLTRAVGSMIGGDMGPMMGGGTTKRDAPAPAAGADTIDVTAHEFSFSPARVEVPGGEAVNVAFHNDGSAFHTFTVESEDFNLEAKLGDRVTAALDLAPGTYEFICTASGHASSGREGRSMLAREVRMCTGSRNGPQPRRLESTL